MPYKVNLRAAGKTYSACAKVITSKFAVPGQPTSQESELRIAFGIASDWTRRAAAMHDLSYSSRRMRKSPSTPAVTEMVRFNLAWSGMNALFSRNSTFALFGSPPPKSELHRFQFLFNNCGLGGSTLSSELGALHQLLQAKKSSFVPGHPAGTHLPVLQVMHEKYTPIQYRGLATGKLVHQVVQTGNYSLLDLPTILYLTRNWSVHGGIISTSFRSVPGFSSYMETACLALSVCHTHVSAELLRRL
jgi:hypothetical protein